MGTTIDIKMREINYKCISRWYITPSLLNKYQSEKEALCWRGCGYKGTMTHIWWECPIIQKFWGEIESLIQEITGEKLPKTPDTYLFHNINLSEKQYKRSVIPHLINAAKYLIPKWWQRSECPTIREWVAKVENTYILEELYHLEQNKVETFRYVWKKWGKFKETKKYVEIRRE